MNYVAKPLLYLFKKFFRRIALVALAGVVIKQAVCGMGRIAKRLGNKLCSARKKLHNDVHHKMEIQGYKPNMVDTLKSVILGAASEFFHTVSELFSIGVNLMPSYTNT